MDSLSSRGLFFLPYKEKRQIPGSISFSPSEGIILELDGTFSDTYHRTGFIDPMDETLYPDLVLGETNDGKKFTLVSCDYFRWEGGGDGNLIISYTAQYLIEGAHIKKTDNLKFWDMQFSIPYINRWFRDSGIKHVHPEPGDMITVRYRRQDPILFGFHQYFRIKLMKRPGESWSHYPTDTVTIIENTYFYITTSKKMPLLSFLKIIEALERFFCLVTRRPIIARDIKCTYIKRKQSIYDEVVNLYYRHSNIPSEINEKSIPMLLFDFDSIRNRLPNFFNQWIIDQERLGPVLDLLFNNEYNPYLYDTNRFLNIIQALETYHRRTRKGFELSPKDHEKKVDAILTSTPEEYRKWLKMKLMYSNEFSLRKRFQELYNDTEFVLNRVIKNKKKFINKVICTRNYYIHFDNTNKKCAAEGIELVRIIRNLEHIMVILLLLELDFEEKEIIGFYRKYIRHPI